MAINKVVYGGETLMDLTGDTVTPQTLAAGVTAHTSNGEQITGVAPTTAVLYTGQTLTDAQKAQARENIGAVAEVDVPKRGVDYWTPADQESIVQDVITALGTPVFGSVGENGVIDLKGELPNGLNTFYYVNADGTRTAIGSIEIGSVNYINQIPISTDGEGNVYNTKGYKEDVRVSGGVDATYEGVTTTGYIPIREGDIIYLKNVTMPKGGNYSCRAIIFNAKKEEGGTQSNVTESSPAEWVWDENNNAVQFKIPSGYFTSATPNRAAFVRVQAAYIGPDSIITVNEPIE